MNEFVKECPCRLSYNANDQKNRQECERVYKGIELSLRLEYSFFPSENIENTNLKLSSFRYIEDLSQRNDCYVIELN